MKCRSMTRPVSAEMAATKPLSDWCLFFQDPSMLAGTSIFNFYIMKEEKLVINYLKANGLSNKIN